MGTQPDIISCFAIIFSKKSCFKRVMALVVLAEGGFALFTGLLWCFQGIYKGSGYDAIVNSIGVLFIHDLDEQLFSAMEKMESSRLRRCFAKCCKRCTCCHNLCSLLCTFVFIVIVAACGQLVMVSPPSPPPPPPPPPHPRSHPHHTPPHTTHHHTPPH